MKNKQEKIKEKELLEKKAKIMKKIMDDVSKISDDDIMKALKELGDKSK